MANKIMKKALLLLLLSLAPFLTGCGIYGEGETIGYIYAVDDGLIWDKTWYKSNLQSSESDCYLIKNDELKKELKEIGETKVKLSYKRHFTTANACPEGTGTNDEIVSFEIIE